MSGPEPTGVDLADPRTAYVLAMADDELVIGHRHSFWTGVAPSLEEDLAFSTIAQDEINHADVWYSLLVGDARREVDRLGLGREAHEYRHAVLCERPPGDFADTLARQFCYDHFDAVRLEALTSSTDADLAATARRLLHEERYHRIHADEWLRRIARGPESAARHQHAALVATWPDALGLLEPVPGEDELVAAGLLAHPTPELFAAWSASMAPVLADCGWTEVVSAPAADAFAEPGGRRGRHSADWHDDVWPEMTGLYREHPEAVW